MDDIGDLQIVEAGRAEPGDLSLPERAGRVSQGDGCRDDRVPSLAEVGLHALIEQAVDIVHALAVVRGETGVHRGAEHAAVAAGCRGRRKLALGPREALGDVVEDVLVDEGARLQDLGIACEETEVVVLGPRGVDEPVVVPLGELLLGQRRGAAASRPRRA